MTFKYNSKETNVELTLEANEMIAMLKESGSELKDLIAMVNSPDFIPGICKIGEMVQTSNANQSKMRFENDMALTKAKAEHEEKMEQLKHNNEMEIEKLRAETKLDIEKARAGK